MLQRYRCYGKDDLGYPYDALYERDEHGDWYDASDADASFAKLDQELSQAASAVEAKGMEIVGLRTRRAELEKALHRLVKAVELFDNETDGGLSKWDPAVTEAKDLLGTSS